MSGVQIDENKIEQTKEGLFIVTGAAGHLGGAITEKLNEQKKTVFILCLPDEKHIPQGEYIKVFYGDVCDIGSLTGMFEDSARYDVTLIHCAGIVSISSRFDQRVYDVNVKGTTNIISLCDKYDVGKLVYISSVHAIPEPAEDEVITETDHFSPRDVVGLYAKTKAEATNCVLEYIKSGHNASIIHPSGIVGPGDYGRGHITQLVIDFYKGGLTSGVGGGYDFVDVRDVADGVLSCCENSRSGESYILSGKYCKVCEILSMLHEITGKRKIKRILPLWFVKLTAPLCELYYRILKQPPLFTAYSLYTLNSHAKFSNEKAKRELKYETRPMRQTLIDTVNWLKAAQRI